MNGSWSRVTHRLRLLALVGVLTLSACSARVTGYESPLAHDYAVVDWLPLTAPVAQPFLSGSGYSDAIDNDAKTTPQQLRTRQAALPVDARDGTLRELRVGVRLHDDNGAQWQTGARAQLLYAPDLDTRWSEEEFHAWPDSDYWLAELAGPRVIAQTFTSPYPLLAGVTLRIATFGGDLTPGTATVGTLGAGVLDLPVDGAPIGTLSAGQQVQVTSALEGWAQVQLPGGGVGYAPLAAFASLPAPARVVQGALHAVLRDGVSGNPLRVVDVPAAQLRDNSHLDVRFEPLRNSIGTTYTLELSMPDAQPGSGITVRATPLTETSADHVAPMYDSCCSEQVNLVFRPIYADTSAAPAFDASLDDLPRDGDWLRITRPPDLASGAVVALRIVPGGRPDAGRLEYGLTIGRAPFGGWFAHDDAGAALNGALLVSTRYERQVKLGGVLHAALARVRRGARADPGFVVLYALVLAALALGAACLLLRRPGWVDDGR